MQCCFKFAILLLHCSVLLCFTGLELNSSIDALIQVNMTVGRLLSLTQQLQMELNNLTNQVTQLQGECSRAVPPVPPSVCDSIPTLSYTVTVNYSVVRSVCVCVRACVCVGVGVCVCVPFKWLKYIALKQNCCCL